MGTLFTVAIPNNQLSSIDCGHYTASVNCCDKTFYCNDDKITECSNIDTRNSATMYIYIYTYMYIYMYILLYKWTVECP